MSEGAAVCLGPHGPICTFPDPGGGGGGGFREDQKGLPYLAASPSFTRVSMFFHMDLVGPAVAPEVSTECRATRSRFSLARELHSGTHTHRAPDHTQATTTHRGDGGLTRNGGQGGRPAGLGRRQLWGGDQKRATVLRGRGAMAHTHDAPLSSEQGPAHPTHLKPGR